MRHILAKPILITTSEGISSHMVPLHFMQYNHCCTD
jgi:hypothetical protein